MYTSKQECVDDAEIHTHSQVEEKLDLSGQLDDNSHSVVFSGGTWKVMKVTMVLARG